jgi:hypothetical protein
MSDMNSRDLKRSLRKNYGRRSLAEWSRLLSLACCVDSTTTSFLSIEETEELKKAFYRVVRDQVKTSRSFWQDSHRDGLAAHLLADSIIAQDIEIIMFSHMDQFVGAVRVPAVSVLRNAMAVWQVVGEDLSLATHDLQNGLCLERNFYTAEGAYVSSGIYELSEWGIFAEFRRP